MPSFSDLMAAPFYLEFAPPRGGPTQVENLYVFRDNGLLSGRGSGQFATDLFTLSVTISSSSDTQSDPHVTLAQPRPGYSRRPAPFCGIIAGMRLLSRPEQLPARERIKALADVLRRVRVGDDELPALVAALDELARDLTFAPRPHAFSERTGRRKIREETGMSQRRLATIRRFRHLLCKFGGQTGPLSDLALEAGYYDQPHMSSDCRAFAKLSPGALRGQATRQPFGRFLQDQRLKSRLRLIING